MTATVSNASLKDKDLERIPKTIQSHLLLLNDITMDFLALNDGDTVKVIEKDKVYALIAWRCQTIKNICSVSSTAKELNRRGEDIETTLVIEKIHQTFKASVITVTTSSLQPEMQVILEARKRLVGRSVFNGMTVDVDEEENDGEDESLQFTVSGGDGTPTSGGLSDSMDRLSVSGGHTSFFLVTEETRIVVKNASVSYSGLSSIAGLEKEIKELKELTVDVIRRREALTAMKASPVRGLILYGFTGTGKTSLMHAFVQEYHGRDLSCYAVNSASLLGKTFEVTEKNLRQVMSLATQTAPSLLFLDRFEVLASSKSKNETTDEKRLIHCLITHLEILNSLPPSKMVILVGVTNSVEDISSSLRGPSRLAIEVELPIPLARHRLEILKHHLSKITHSVPESGIESLSSTAYSFTGADLALVVSRACCLAKESVTIDDLELSFSKTKPSAMKELISLEVPKVCFESIGGVSLILSRLRQVVVWPFKYCDYLSRMFICGHKGVLLYGPPGCSKTMIGKALATECKLNFLSIKGPEVLNKYVGESEKAVRDLFRKARQASPCIVFFDEVDALTMTRDTQGSSVVSERVLATLLTELDGIQARDEVIVVAATNRPDKIDPAIKRPGRLDAQIYVRMPDMLARQEIFKIKFKEMPVKDNVKEETLAERTQGYSGAEVVAVCTEAALAAINDALDSNTPAQEAMIDIKHFEKALQIVKPRTDPKTIDFFEEYSRHN